MVDTPSTMLALGSKAPYFKLPDFDGTIHSMDQFEGKPLLVMFICNHCPFVKHVVSKLSKVVRSYQEKGIGVVAINANDIRSYPQDSPQNMKKFSEQHAFTFPYLYDETQEVAKAYKAACTPDFFLFDKDKRLVYRGQMDDSRPGNNIPVTGNDLTTAVDHLVEGKPIPSEQKPSIGCNIKWKKGNEPDYFG